MDWRWSLSGMRDGDTQGMPEGYPRDACSQPNIVGSVCSQIERFYAFFFSRTIIDHNMYENTHPLPPCKQERGGGRGREEEEEEEEEEK